MFKIFHVSFATTINDIQGGWDWLHSTVSSFCTSGRWYLSMRVWEVLHWLPDVCSSPLSHMHTHTHTSAHFIDYRYVRTTLVKCRAWWLSECNALDTGHETQTALVTQLCLSQYMISQWRNDGNRLLNEYRTNGTRYTSMLKRKKSSQCCITGPFRWYQWNPHTKCQQCGWYAHGKTASWLLHAGELCSFNTVKYLTLDAPNLKT